MKNCNHCGKKISDDMKFCAHCGHKITKETDISKVVLLVGVFVVLFSSFAFGIVSWKSMSELYKILFFTFETLLFFILSFALKRVSKHTARTFFIIGLILVPFTLTLVPYYNLIIEYFREGAGLYVYLASIYLLSFITYFLINLKFKSNIVNVLGLILLLMSFIDIANIFNTGIVLTSLLIVCYIMIVNVLSKVSVFSTNYRKVLSVFSLVLGLVYTPVLIYTFTKVGEIHTFINIITFIIYSVDSFFKLSCDKNSVLRGFNPFTLSPLVFTLITCNLPLNICLYAITISFILLFFISMLFKDKTYINISLVFTYFAFLIVILIGFITNNYFALIISSIVMILFNISVLVILKYNVVHFILPINYIVMIIAISKNYMNISGITIISLLMILFLVSYLLLKLGNRKSRIAYLIFTLIIGAISLGFINGNNYISLVAIILMLITFSITYIFKENVTFSIISYILLNMTIMAFFDSLYYIILLIGGITIAITVILSKITKSNLKPYMLYAQIIVFLATLTCGFNYPVSYLALNAIVYVLCFITLLKYFNISFYRIIYIMLGFILLNRFMILLFNVTFISNLVTIILVVILLIVLYLLDKEKSVYLVIESLTLLLPYYGIINEYYYMVPELYLVPLVIYSIAFTSAIKFKENETRRILTIILLSFIALFFLAFNSGIVSIICDVLYALVFIVLGLIRKQNILIYFGIGFLILTTIFNLFTVLNSLAIVITLLIIGFILIGLAIFFEVRKKD